MAVLPKLDEHAITHGRDAAYPDEFAYDDEYAAKVTDANDIKD